MKTLAEAITTRMDQARLLGWQPGRRVHIEIDAQGTRLIMSWRGRDGAAMLPDDPRDPTVARGNIVSLKGDLPPGISAQGWSALPETIDDIDRPTREDVANAARQLGRDEYDRMDYPDDRVVYHMGPPKHAADPRLARAGQLLYGERWQSDLARALGIGDRRVRQWLAGDRPIPEGIWRDIAELLRVRIEDAAKLMGELVRS